MNCQVLSTLYVKANGEIPCECDAGERVTLGCVEAGSGWSLWETLNNDAYLRVRAALARDEAPWGAVCSACSFLRPHEATRDTLGIGRITKLQVEPSIYCGLRCPCCSRLRQMEERRPPHVLPLGLFETLLERCVEEGYTVDFIEYCGQGEPLTHPEFHGLVHLARTILPDTRQRLITNGNCSYHEVMRGERLDEIYVSCDGVYQESYERYRVNGSVQKALRFMEEAKHGQGDHAPLVVWKYILFEFNDSDGELIAAQHKAADLGVDALSFVMTHTEFKSKRFHTEGVEFIPIQTPFTSLDRTPVSTGLSVRGTPLSLRDSRLGRVLEHTTCVVDDVRLISGRYLTLRGWAMGSRENRIVGIRGFADRHEGSDATLGIPRPDVNATCPEFADRGTGFFFSATLPRPPDVVVTIRLVLRTAHGETEEFEVVYAFESIIQGKLLSSPSNRFRRLLARTVCAVDDVGIIAGRYLRLGGWAMGRGGRAIRRIGVSVDGNDMPDAKRGLLRPDVLARFPRLSDLAPGFLAIATLPDPPRTPTVIRIRVMTHDGGTEEFEFTCNFE
ncbi:hypothetical protein JXA88_08980 [Candidatus Fermentibacteria bacterium]|nr:hypothetical protein [Candidatus Fermentibacteria bacterium]